MSGRIGVYLKLFVGEVLATATRVSAPLDDLTPVYEAPAVGALHLHNRPNPRAADNKF